MPNQSKNNEEIAAKAGINIVYPGLSESKSKFTAFDSKVYELEKYHSNNTYKSLIEINKVRKNKYQSPDTYKITTNETETSAKYPDHFKKPNFLCELNQTPNKIIKTENKNAYYNEKFILGKTEYYDRYKKPTNTIQNESTLKINPKIDLTHGSYGRPYEKLSGQDIQYETQYKTAHQWPVPEPLGQRFEWLNL